MEPLGLRFCKWIYKLLELKDVPEVIFGIFLQVKVFHTKWMLDGLGMHSMFPFLFLENMTPYRTEGVHFLVLMNSATTVSTA